MLATRATPATPAQRRAVHRRAVQRRWPRDATSRAVERRLPGGRRQPRRQPAAAGSGALDRVGVQEDEACSAEALARDVPNSETVGTTDATVAQFPRDR
jgi:hypothetical protein